MRRRLLTSVFLLATLFAGMTLLASPSFAAQPDITVKCDQATKALNKSEKNLKETEKSALEQSPGLELTRANRDVLVKAVKGLDANGDGVADDPTKATELASLVLKVKLINAVLLVRGDVANNQRIKDRDCAPPSTTPAPPSSSTPAPAPSDRFDCVDFPLEDGTTSQQQYDKDRTDAKHDPNLLDLDGDGKACETDEQNNGGNIPSASVPQGGVETGNGVSDDSGPNLLATFLLALVGVAATTTAVYRWSR